MLAPQVQNSKSEALQGALQNGRDTEGIACEPQKLAGSPLGFRAVSDTQLPTATLDVSICMFPCASVAQHKTSSPFRSVLSCKRDWNDLLKNSSIAKVKEAYHPSSLKTPDSSQAVRSHFLEWSNI